MRTEYAYMLNGARGAPYVCQFVIYGLGDTYDAEALVLLNCGHLRNALRSVEAGANNGTFRYLKKGINNMPATKPPICAP